MSLLSAWSISLDSTFKLYYSIPGFPYNCLLVFVKLKKNPRSSISLETRPESAFTTFRALLPSADKSTERSVRVWQPSADSNGHLEHQIWRGPNGHCYLQLAVTPDPVSLRQTAITICRGLSHPTGWAALSSKNISRRFFKGVGTLWEYK